MKFNNEKRIIILSKYTYVDIPTKRFFLVPDNRWEKGRLSKVLEDIVRCDTIGIGTKLYIIIILLKTETTYNKISQLCNLIVKVLSNFIKVNKNKERNRKISFDTLIILTQYIPSKNLRKKCANFSSMKFMRLENL